MLNIYTYADAVTGKTGKITQPKSLLSHVPLQLWLTICRILANERLSEMLLSVCAKGPLEGPPGKATLSNKMGLSPSHPCPWNADTLSGGVAAVL